MGIPITNEQLPKTSSNLRMVFFVQPFSEQESKLPLKPGYLNILAIKRNAAPGPLQQRDRRCHALGQAH